MGDEPVGDRDDLDETESANITLKTRTWLELEAEYRHALDRQEQIRSAIHDALKDDRDADETE